MCCKLLNICRPDRVCGSERDRQREREREISVIEKWSSYYIYIYHEQRLWLWLAPRLTDVKRRTMGHLQNCSSSSEKDKGNIFRPGTRTITGNGRRTDKWTGCCCVFLLRVASTRLSSPRLAGTTKIPINSMRHNRHLGWLWGMSQHPKGGVAHIRGRLWALLCCRCLSLSCVCSNCVRECVWQSWNLWHLCVPACITHTPHGRAECEQVSG